MSLLKVILSKNVGKSHFHALIEAHLMSPPKPCALAGLRESDLLFLQLGAAITSDINQYIVNILAR